MLTTEQKVRAFLAALYTGRRWEVEVMENNAVRAESPGGQALVPNGATALEMLAILDANEAIERTDAERQTLIDELSA